MSSGYNGFSMPAEWAPHDACLLQWPHNPSVFRLTQARQQFLGIAKAIATEGKETVVIFCPNEKEQAFVQEELIKMELKESTIITRVCPSDDSWARDMGPTFALSKNNEQRIGIDWNFNAWGEIYPDYKQDQLVAERMCQELKKESFPMDHRKVPIVLEGGSIHVDGEGTLLTTKECLLHPNRNPSKTQAQLEAILCEQLGVQKVVWLPLGVDGDEDTNGHVDNFACFLKPGHVILSWTDDEEQDKVNYERCREALSVLEQETDAQGRSLTVHKLYLPPPMFYTKEEVKGLKHTWGLFAPRKVGERMAGSYVNFYVANQAVIIPQFGHADTDQKAVDTLKDLFPNRKVVGVPSKEILIGGGNIHCITQQLPKCSS
ncbi:Agmatine deiminase [Seminavis robusta]|uniref:Agmatine deiminase n=1 Tax=Seminavis robusta TaxID=568900 RepID=A0A9N8E6C2_9STRA|nr:Agmatine deiminase [Seminavis robusta]|eukprot:Sro543_g163520.1 Agmatine deiminase (375) ;mRNA; r:24270-25507